MSHFFPTLESLFLWVLRTSWEASLLVLLILAAGWLLEKWIQPRWRYALWLLVVIRLLLPQLPTSKFSINEAVPFPIPPAQIAEASIPVTRANRSANLPSTPPQPKRSYPPLFASLWLLGAAGFGISLAIANLRFARNLRNARLCDDDALLELANSSARELGLRTTPPIFETRHVSGPAVIGLFRPKLLLPDGLIAAFSPDELRMIFLHEFAHLRRGDTAMNFLMAALQVVHWFNPVIWIAFARMRHDREIATDGLALSGERSAKKRLYGETLIKLLDGFKPQGSPSHIVGIMETPANIKERLTLIKQATSKASRGMIVGLGLLAALGVTALTQEEEIASPATPPSKPTEPTKPVTKAEKPDPTRPLSSEEVAALEKQIAEQPDSAKSLSARVKLLKYYQVGGIFLESIRAAAQPHILWLIRNRPESKEAGREFRVDKIIDPKRYEEAAQAWKDQIAQHPKNAKILGNAANFFLIHDRTEAEALLLQAQELEPDNKEWPEQLGLLYTLNARSPGDRSENKKALNAYQRALEKSRGVDRFYALDETAKAAFNAGEIALAQEYAEELLKLAPDYVKNWNYGNAIYTANSVMGQIALSKGDVAAAKTYLLAAGDTPGSPQLNSFGPDMTLASALLKRGEKETVLAFLDKIALFWKFRPSIIEGWKQSIQAGRQPDFQRKY